MITAIFTGAVVLALYTLLSAIADDDNYLLEDTAVESGKEVNFNRKSQV